MISLSIVICTHRRPDLLSDVVQSLCRQTAPRDAYEVIIVENDAQGLAAIQQLVREASAQIRIRHVLETRIGLSHARNAGGQAAETEYVAYVDDDARLPETYVSNLQCDLEQRHPDLAGGPCLAFYQGTKPSWYKDEYGSLSHGPNARFLTPSEYLFGGNLVFRRGLLQQLGWFDPQHGMAGKKVWYGEETMLEIKAWQQNPALKVWYNPDLFVWHLVPERKMRCGWKLQSAYAMGNSLAYFWMPPEDLPRLRREALRALGILAAQLTWGFGPGLLARDRGQHPFWQNYYFEKQAPRMQSLGQCWRLLSDWLRWEQGCDTALSS